MLTRREFFQRVLPDTGKFCLFSLFSDKSAPTTTNFYPIADALDGVLDSRIAELSQAGREVYFACCTFKEDVLNRNAKSALGYKCFRADIDCGPGKDYDSQGKGLKALKEYIEAAGLPTPIIVNSGRGWHAYWPLDEAVDYNRWKPIADALKKSMQAMNFHSDPSVTADGARVLRIPETQNNKDKEAPAKVEIVHAGEEQPLSVFVDALAVYLVDYNRAEDLGLASEFASAADDPLMKKMLQSSEKSFAKILELSTQTVEVTENVEVVTENKDGSRTSKIVKQKAIRSAGCAQIDYIYKNRASEDINHDVWRAALSIAWNCADRDTAIHDISIGHPDYNPQETLIKAMSTEDKPQKCGRFQSFKPELCLTCIHKNKPNPITTPITLGMTIVAATPLDNLQTDVWHEGLNDFTDVEIPSTYPKNWFRPKAGGVAMKGMEDEEDDKIVYEHDLWVSARIEDPNFGAMVEVISILPVDGMRVFNMPQAYITKKDKMLEVLSENHVAISPPNFNKIQAYITDWIKYWQAQSKYRVAREHFGWQDNNTRFVVGTKEIQPDGTIEYSPPCSTTEEVAAKYYSSGELRLWQEVINSYDLPGNEARAFALFAGFGTPLYKFFNVNSMILHLTNSASGVGKSTILLAINSIWGHPVETMLNESDTALSRQQRAALLSNLPVTNDEITNMQGEEISKYVFNFSFDRGRNRMQAHTNAERKNTATWNTISFTSGNNSLYDSLKSYKSSTQGEMFRIAELQIFKDETKTKAEADYLFNNLLRENYGMAGIELMQYIVPNLDAVVKEAKELQLKLDKEMGWIEGNIRYYSAMCASAFTAARIAKKLGLHSIDVDRVQEWAIQTFQKVSHEVIESGSNDSLDVLGNFFNEHIRNVLMVNDYTDFPDENRLPQVVSPPTGELIIRYEPNTRAIYIAKYKLQSWCAEQRVPYAPFWQDMLRQGAAVGEGRICLSRGTSLPGAVVWVSVFHADHIGWNVDNLKTEE